MQERGEDLKEVVDIFLSAEPSDITGATACAQLLKIVSGRVIPSSIDAAPPPTHIAQHQWDELCTLLRTQWETSWTARTKTPAPDSSTQQAGAGSPKAVDGGWKVLAAVHFACLCKSFNIGVFTALPDFSKTIDHALGVIGCKEPDCKSLRALLSAVGPVLDSQDDSGRLDMDRFVAQLCMWIWLPQNIDNRTAIVAMVNVSIDW